MFYYVLQCFTSLRMIHRVSAADAHVCRPRTADVHCLPAYAARVLFKYVLPPPARDVRVRKRRWTRIGLRPYLCLAIRAWSQPHFRSLASDTTQTSLHNITDIEYD